MGLMPVSVSQNLVNGANAPILEQEYLGNPASTRSGQLRVCVAVWLRFGHRTTKPRRLPDYSVDLKNSTLDGGLETRRLRTRRLLPDLTSLHVGFLESDRYRDCAHGYPLLFW